MKSVVKIVKSLHADSHTLNAMFFGYFVLLAITVTMVLSTQNTKDGSKMAHSKLHIEQAK